MIREAVVLSGGLGTRLRPLTLDTPKPLLPVGGRAFLDYLLWNLARHGIRRVHLTTGYLAHKVEQHCREHRPAGMEVRCAPEETPLGTGGGLKRLLPELADQVLVLNGDSLFDVNYLGLAALLRAGDADAALALRTVPDVSRYGSITLEGQRVASFAEKPPTPRPGLVNGGVYAMRTEVLHRLPAGPCSLEQDLFPGLARDGRLLGLPGDGFFIDIGLPETYAQAQESVPAWRRKPALFLDRDGVLNRDRGYVHRPEDVEWLPGAVETVRRFNDLGYLVMVVTNQAGIARGYYSEAAFHAFMDWMGESLAEHGGHLDAVYHCPHHPTEGQGPYRRECDCRKPNPGMLLRAMAEWEVDRAGSFLVGDKPSDVEAARRAGIAAFQYAGGDLLELCLRARTGL